MNSKIILIDYEQIRKNYDNALISTARGFENLYEFLDYWGTIRKVLFIDLYLVPLL